jgi:hypothetical protein
MDLLEDFVDWVITGPFIPPALDDSFIVAIDWEVGLAGLVLRKEPSKALEANRFGPWYVSIASVKCLPAWDKSPSLPPTANDNCNSKAWAGIGESPNIVK